MVTRIVSCMLRLMRVIMDLTMGNIGIITEQRTRPLIRIITSESTRMRIDRVIRLYIRELIGEITTAGMCVVITVATCRLMRRITTIIMTMVTIIAMRRLTIRTIS